MHKALYGIINGIGRGFFVNNSNVTAQAVQVCIRQEIRKLGLRKVVPCRDIIQASQVLLKRLDEAESNMCKVYSARNFYEIKLAHPVLRESGAQYIR